MLTCWPAEVTSWAEVGMIRPLLGANRVVEDMTCYGQYRQTTHRGRGLRRPLVCQRVWKELLDRHDGEQSAAQHRRCAQRHSRCQSDRRFRPPSIRSTAIHHRSISLVLELRGSRTVSISRPAPPRQRPLGACEFEPAIVCSGSVDASRRFGLGAAEQSATLTRPTAVDRGRRSRPKAEVPATTPSAAISPG